MRFRLTVFTASWLAGASPALGYCFEPPFFAAAPEAPGSYERPDVPYCLSSYSYSGQHTCDERELNSYRDEVEDYIGKLNAYLSDATQFAREAINYATNVEAYAKCEAEEVTTQHK